MRQGQQGRRGRGRNNNQRKGQHHHNPLMRTFQSNGPDQKIGQDAVDRLNALRKELDQRLAELNALAPQQKN